MKSGAKLETEEIKSKRADRAVKCRAGSDIFQDRYRQRRSMAIHPLASADCNRSARKIFRDSSLRVRVRNSPPYYSLSSYQRRQGDPFPLDDKSRHPSFFPFLLFFFCVEDLVRDQVIRWMRYWRRELRRGAISSCHGWGGGG